jgi:hypothetical protein
MPRRRPRPVRSGRALPRLTGSLAAALVGTAVMTLFFEFTIVGLPFSSPGLGRGRVRA